ncbi:MAG: hypothetical protein ACRDJC_25615, partial [Thermomicrobiales bacterium]
GYLHTGMKTVLSADDLADPTIPKVPDFEIHPPIDPDFVIVTVSPPRSPQEVAFALPIEAGLSVTTGDAPTEIFLFDERHHLIAQGADRLQRDLGPGRYRVQVRAGETTAEKEIALPGGRLSVDFPPLTFASPAPLPNTALSDADHRQAAIAQSRETHVRTGEGSQVYVVARDWRAPEITPSQDHPAAGLLLLDAAGATVADIGARSWSDLRERPLAACNVEVTPGPYRLSLTTQDGQRFEQSVIAAAGWQTQVFLLVRADDWVPGGSRLDLNGAAILMADLGRRAAFDPDQPEERLVELLRFGLAGRRQVLSDQLRWLLAQESVNPMLGILGGHVLLRDPAADPELLRTLVATLRAAVGPLRHPDVEALALRTEPPAGSDAFATPPMLRRSWSLVLDATVTQPALVPAGSLAASIADRIWGVEPWLIWETAPADETEVSFGLAEASPAGPQDSDIELALRRQLQPPTGRADADVEIGLESAGGAAAEPDEATMRRLVKTLGLPRARVEEMLGK